MSSQSSLRTTPSCSLWVDRLLEALVSPCLGQSWKYHVFPTLALLLGWPIRWEDWANQWAFSWWIGKRNGTQDLDENGSCVYGIDEVLCNRPTATTTSPFLLCVSVTQRKLFSLYRLLFAWCTVRCSIVPVFLTTSCFSPGKKVLLFTHCCRCLCSLAWRDRMLHPECAFPHSQCSAHSFLLCLSWSYKVASRSLLPS